MTTPSMQQAIKEVENRPCNCIPCHECKGNGQVYFSFGGWKYGRYLGSSRCDDLDEPETCDVCGGRGIVEQCDRCGELDELYQQEDE